MDNFTSNGVNNIIRNFLINQYTEEFTDYIFDGSEREESFIEIYKESRELVLKLADKYLDQIYEEISSIPEEEINAKVKDKCSLVEIKPKKEKA